MPKQRLFHVNVNVILKFYLVLTFPNLLDLLYLDDNGSLLLGFRLCDFSNSSHELLWH